MGEVELVEGALSRETREFETTLDGLAVTALQLQIGQTLQSHREVKIAVGGLSRHRLQILRHGRQGQSAEFLFQGHRQKFPFGLAR
jgi:hypothetical protein